MKIVKRAIKGLASRLGYRIERSPSPLFTDDPFAAMQRLLAHVPRPVIFDVGAHNGHISSMFLDRFPAATVHAFEPSPVPFEELQARAAADTRIHAHQFGLSSVGGLCSFHCNVRSGTNSLLATDPIGARTWGEGVLETREVIQSPFRTLDEVVDELGVPRIDILKLDVQGAEHLVMAGAADACSRGRIGLIYSEVITQPTYVAQKRLDDALATYFECGFDLYNIYNMSFSGDGRLRQFDAIFTSRS